jgi:SnoaL-like protein
MTNDPRTIVERFFAAQVANDKDAMLALMAPNLEYANVLNSYASAEAFLGPLMGFNKLLRGIAIVQCIVDGNRAAVLYDCDIPPPIGTLRTAWFVSVENGKLRTIQSIFDATEIRKMFT